MKQNNYAGAFFSRNGDPITLGEWVVEFQSKHRFYKRVEAAGYTSIAQWVGVDMPAREDLSKAKYSWSHWIPNDPPMLFSHVVYDADNEIVESKRFTTIEEAYAAHANLVSDLATA